MPWRPSSGRSAARSSRASALTGWTASRPRVPCSSTRPRGPSWPSPAIACRRRTRRRYEAFRYGSGVFKIDWALDGPVPWTADGLRRAGTVHLGGTLDEVVQSESDVAAGRHAERPFTLLVQYHPWDPSRAPAGKTTAWAYCHVPSGSDVDMTDADRGPGRAIRPGLPRPASSRAPRTRRPRWRRTTRTTSAATSTPASRTSARLLFRPVPSLDPYHAGPGLYLCSSSTPPGGGVHGMSGHLAAQSALRRDLR